jgi:uncharacterized protein (TIGR02145 family)
MLKKLLILFSLAFLFVACNQKTSEPEIELYVEHGEFTDSRDGQTYKTVTIESQTWMAENLNYKTDSSYCYNDSAENCAKYGRLYIRSEALKECPEGWRLPEYKDFDLLKDFIGSDFSKKVKSSTDWIIKRHSGTDSYGFNILPAGERRDGVYYYKGYYAKLWIATDYSGVIPRFYGDQCEFYGSHLWGRYIADQTTGSSVRCIKD